MSLIRSFYLLEIVFVVTAKTTGWIGLGLSPNGNMANSDIIWGQVPEILYLFSDVTYLCTFPSRFGQEVLL